MENDPRGFLSTYSRRVLIDEAQRVPALFSYLQGVVDRNNRPGQYVLTGSQNFLLHEKISQSLAGRTAVLKLLPAEPGRTNQKEDRPGKVQKFLFRGLSPRTVAQSVSPTDWYGSYVQTYLERDLRLIKNIPDLGLFQKFVRLCAGRIGQVLNFSPSLDCRLSPTPPGPGFHFSEATTCVLLVPTPAILRLIKWRSSIFMTPAWPVSLWIEARFSQAYYLVAYL